MFGQGSLPDMTPMGAPVSDWLEELYQTAKCSRSWECCILQWDVVYSPGRASVFDSLVWLGEPRIKGHGDSQ